MWRFLIFLTLAAVAPGAIAQTKPVECYCTNTTGDRVEMGQEICLTVGGRQFMALCDMSLNVPTWRDTGAECLSG